MPKIKPCVRCGTCCLLGPCVFGDADEDTGVCRWLIPNTDGTMTCQQLLTSVEARAHLLGRGCPLRSNENLFNEAVQTVAPIKTQLLKHLDRAKNNVLINKLRHKRTYNANY